MHLEYQALLQAEPGARSASQAAAGRDLQRPKRPAKGVRGVFFCYALPLSTRRRANSPKKPARRAGISTTSIATRSWKSRERSSPASARSPTPRGSAPRTRRRSSTSAAKVEKHIKNTYLKRVDAPVGVKPALKCWMELNEG